MVFTRDCILYIEHELLFKNIFKLLLLNTLIKDCSLFFSLENADVNKGQNDNRR